MTTIANCSNLLEAQQLQSVLEAADIPSFIPDEMTAGIAPHHFLGSAGIRLQVAEEFAEEARKLIETEQAKS